MSLAIKIENLSKQYRLGLVSTRTLSHDLNRWWQTSILGREDPYLKIGETNIRETKGESEYVWALKDINLEVEQGEVLGIIGKNGAGKSTLLKILSKVTAPTTGIVKARGRIASLLEVGTGFHQEMTGRENIYLNGAIMGMTKYEITRKLDEIVDFAGVERYIDTPVKRYSSGMTVRLGFAVAAHLEPEILVVDEVLAVGDAEFQKKALGKMQEVSKGHGRTVLFVSHNMVSVKKLCNRSILLGNGKICYSGKTESVIDKYLEFNQGLKNFDLAERSYRKGIGTAKFIEIELISDSNKVNFIKMGEGASFNIKLNSEIHIKNVNIILAIYNNNGIVITKTSTRLTSNKLFNLKIGKNSARCYFNSLPLQKGSYTINLALKRGNILYDWIENALVFNVIDNDIYGTGENEIDVTSLFFLQNNWTVSGLM